MLPWHTLLILPLAASFPTTQKFDINNLPKRSFSQDGVIHIPLQRKRSHHLAKRLTQLSIGDDDDTRYTIQITLGGSTVTVAFDTGSSALWSLTEGGAKAEGFPINGVSTANARNTSLPIDLAYGTTGTDHSQGWAVNSSASFAGFEFDKLSWIAQTFDNTTISPSQYYTGIMGAASPVDDLTALTLFATNKTEEYLVTQQAFSDFAASWTELGGPIQVLCARNALPASAYTFTLQRAIPSDTPNSNVGLLSIGGLPPGVQESQLTFSNVLPQRIGRALFGNTTNEWPQVPTYWLIPLTGIYLGGQHVTQFASSSGNISALIDSGTPTLSVPYEFTQAVIQQYGLKSKDDVPCDLNIQLGFQFGTDQIFYINPLDLIVLTSSTTCKLRFTTRAQGSDTINEITGFQWILGDDFLRSTLAYLDFGDTLTSPINPSKPARIGLMSTLDMASANQTLAENVKKIAQATQVIQAAGTTTVYTYGATQSATNNNNNNGSGTGNGVDKIVVNGLAIMGVLMGLAIL